MHFIFKILFIFNFIYGVKKSDALYTGKIYSNDPNEIQKLWSNFKSLYSKTYTDQMTELARYLSIGKLFLVYIVLSL